MEINNMQDTHIISIGRQREMDATVLEFNLAHMAVEYGAGTAVLVHRRPGESRAYIATTTQNGNLLTWRISQVDTWFSGFGEAEIRWMVNTDDDATDYERIAKTAVFTTKIIKSIVDETEEQPGGIVYLADGRQITTNKNDIARIKEDIEDLDDKVDTYVTREIGANLFNKNDVAAGGYYGSNGSIATSDLFVYSSTYSEVEAGTAYYARYKNGNVWARANVAIAWYDANKTFLQQMHNLQSYTAPTTAKYVRISYDTRSGNSTLVFADFNASEEVPYGVVGLSLNSKIAIPSNVLYGKTYVAVGDSFTEGDFTGYVDSDGHSGHDSDAYDSELGMYKTYPWWIGKRNNMKIYNRGICGSTMALNKNTETPYSTNAFAYQRYLELPADIDYLTIWFGINDSTYCNVGTIDDTTNETIYGAWNIVLEYLIEHYPYTKIGIVITDGATTFAVRKAIRQVAQKWGIPYLDMFGDNKVPMMLNGRDSGVADTNLICQRAKELRNSAFQVSSTNTHPNLKAHEYQSTFIENWLRSL